MIGRLVPTGGFRQATFFGRIERGFDFLDYSTPNHSYD
jgi:hypothetical protein